MNSEINARDVLAPIRGKPAWGIKKGVGSFITFEFGKPSLSIREPTERLKRRRITVRGEWHLWIYCCSWKIYEHDRCLATDESPTDAIINAIGFLDGQAFQEAHYNSQLRTTRFVFDLEGVLETAPYQSDPQEQWLLYHEGMVWTAGPDGGITLAPEDEAPTKHLGTTAKG